MTTQVDNIAASKAPAGPTVGEVFEARPALARLFSSSVAFPFGVAARGCEMFRQCETIAMAHAAASDEAASAAGGVKNDQGVWTLTQEQAQKFQAAITPLHVKPANLTSRLRLSEIAHVSLSFVDLERLRPVLIDDTSEKS